MIQKHRIATNIGRDQKVTVEIKQDFDVMEILSLKFSQKDIYSAGVCSEYGVVVGRVSANSGFGIPNAKISIFVPLSDMDVDDPVISKLYPYTSTRDTDDEGYRYNLLPSRQQHGGHSPTGTFPDQQDILTREEVLEVFESYYSYTVKTNSSGDFMIWGVPIGTKTIHVDLDLSDIGCFSLRPYDFIKKGFGPDQFERYYKFKSSVDIDGLPQIVSFDRSVEVYPFWGNEELCEIGITRTDFDLSEKGIKIEPISLILVSSVTDENTHAVKKNGRIRRNSGYKCNLQTTGGKIECVRQTGRAVLGSDGITKYPELEYFNVTEVIDDAGVAMAVLPMNMEYTYTNEFGEQVITNDSNKGIPTTAIARFRISLDFSDRKHATGKYLVPNIREFTPDPGGHGEWYRNPVTHKIFNVEYSEAMLATYNFSDKFEDYLTPSVPTGMTFTTPFYAYGSYEKEHKKDLMLGTNNNGIPEDYFYKFIYGKVYTVSSFQGSHYDSAIPLLAESGSARIRDAFLGVKQIRPNVEEECASKANYFPTNFAFRNRIKFNLLVSQVLLFIQYIFAIIMLKFSESIGRFAYTTGQVLIDVKIVGWHPMRKTGEKFQDFAYKVQDRFTQQHSLVIYPDCEECTSDDDSLSIDSSFDNNYCRAAEVKLKVTPSDGWVYLWVHDTNSGTQFSHAKTAGSTFLPTEFPGESACDNEDLCQYCHTGATEFNYADLRTMHNYTIPNVMPAAKFVGEIYSIPEPPDYRVSGSTSFNNFVLYFDTGSETEERIFNHGTVFSYAGSYMRFTYEEWAYLTGLDYVSNIPKIVDTLTYAVVRIYDRTTEKSVALSGSTLNIETGCGKYDKAYNENMVYTYLWSFNDEYGSSLIPSNPPAGYPSGMTEATTNPGGYNLLATILGRSNTGRLPRSMHWGKIPDTTYDRKTKSGLSEVRDGTFTIIPVVKGTSQNTQALQEWYKRKRVGLFFCGGVVNYSFIDNWLNGVLYFFKFDKRLRWDNESNYDLNIRRSKFPRELIFFNVLDQNFYYRSTPYAQNEFIGQSYEDILEILHPTTFYDVGVRDEFLYEICTDPKIDPTCSVVRDISSTSYQDPANIVEFAINYRLDVNQGKFNVEDFFTGEGYGNNVKVFDGDITQLMSINCEAGIEAFDLDTPHYFMYNGELMDPEDLYFQTFFKNSPSYNLYGPTPIDLKLDYNGAFIRGCLNSRLGDYSQVVPFYLWDKGDVGFGKYGDDSDHQSWDRTVIASMKLQRLFSISGTTAYDLTHTNYLMADGEEEYLLKPMTITHPTYTIYGGTEDMLERFEVISYTAPLTYSGGAVLYIEGDLWLRVLSGSLSDPQSGEIYVVVNSTWTLQPIHYFDGYAETFVPQTVINYASQKQVLSTPFLFYFGLRPEKTALDILIKYFGPKGAFPTESIPCPNYDAGTPSPSSTPPASLLPFPTPSPTRGTVPPTPSPSPSYGYEAPYFDVSPNSIGWNWDQSLSNPKYVTIHTNRDWYLGISGPQPSGPAPSMVFFMHLDTSGDDDSMILKRAPITGLPDWIDMKISWDGGVSYPDAVVPNMAYSWQLRWISLNPNSYNQTGSQRSANIYFSNGVTNYTDPDQYIYVYQPSENEVPPVLPITFSFINNTDFSIGGSEYTDYTLAPTLQFRYTPLTYFEGTQNVPWTIYKIVGGEVQPPMASGVSHGVKYNQQVVQSTILSPPPSSGDLVYIFLGTMPSPSPSTPSTSGIPPE